jgi:hypothetical protein
MRHPEVEIVVAPKSNYNREPNHLIPKTFHGRFKVLVGRLNIPPDVLIRNVVGPLLGVLDAVFFAHSP